MLRYAALVAAVLLSATATGAGAQQRIPEHGIVSLVPTGIFRDGVEVITNDRLKTRWLQVRAIPAGINRRAQARDVVIAFTFGGGSTAEIYFTLDNGRVRLSGRDINDMTRQEIIAELEKISAALREQAIKNGWTPPAQGVRQ